MVYNSMHWIKKSKIKAFYYDICELDLYFCLDFNVDMEGILLITNCKNYRISFIGYYFIMSWQVWAQLLLYTAIFPISKQL